MTNEQMLEHENFVIDLMNGTESHEQWLAVVRFGLKSLLENQALFAEVLAIEAVRMCEAVPTKTAGDNMAQIIQELSLRFEVCS